MKVCRLCGKEDTIGCWVVCSCGGAMELEGSMDARQSKDVASEQPGEELALQSATRNAVVEVHQDYEQVLRVLELALQQTQSGKGKERHASDNPFLEQEIMNGARCCGLGAMVFQVRKKALEAARLAQRGEFQKAKIDVLGSIIYDVALYLRIEEMENQ